MISIVIPIYNEQENLALLYERITRASAAWNDTYEVLFVDDGSTDNSLALMKEFVCTDAHFKVIEFSRNFGHQAAVSAGLCAARGAAVVVMDGDLQDPPEELARFLDKWRQGYEVVYAVRTRRKESWIKRLAYGTFYRILQLISDIDIPLDSGDFCVMDRRVVDVLNDRMPEQNRFVRGLRAYSGFRQIGLAYERASRSAGEPKYTLRKLVKLGLDGIVDFSTFPLHVATYLGVLFAVPSFLLGMLFITSRIVRIDVFGYSPADTPGVATLAVGLFFLGGIILIILGVIGEYLGRIYMEVKRRPTYIVKKTYSQEKLHSRDP